MPNVGLGGSPVGTPLQLPPLLNELVVCARTYGLSPPMPTMVPAVVNRPHFTRSRREIWPCDNAFVISCRFLRAFSASLSRRLSAFGDNQIPSCPSFLRPILFSFLSSSI